MKTKTISTIVIFLFLSCVSKQEVTKRTTQNDVYKIIEQFSVSEIKLIKENKLWINSVTKNKSGLGHFKIRPELHYGKMPIEFQIKDSILRKQILTKENIDFFKQQLISNQYKLISKKLSTNPKIGMIPDEAGYRFWVEAGKYSRHINSIMFTKDGEFALFYVSIFESTTTLWVYKKDNKEWKYYKAFHVGMS